MSKNKNYINVCKVISIICVVLIHIISKIYMNSDVTTTNFKILALIDILIHFCVPVFVMSSGAIFLNRDDSPKKMIFKYALKMYIIFVISNFIYKYLYYQVLSGNPFNINEILNSLISSIKLESVFQLWYLRLAFILYLLTPIIKLLRFNRSKDTIVIIILFFTSFIIYKFTNNNYLLTLFGYTFYYYAGYYFDKYNLKRKKYILYSIGLIALIYSYIMTLRNSLPGYPDINYMEYLTPNIMLYSISIFILIKNITPKLTNQNIFNYLSKYSFGTYLIHGLVIGVLQYINIINIYNPNTNILILLLYTLLTLICCYIILFIYKKIISMVHKSS